MGFHEADHFLNGRPSSVSVPVNRGTGNWCVLTALFCSGSKRNQEEPVPLAEKATTAFMTLAIASVGPACVALLLLL